MAKLQGKKITGSMGPYERPEDIPGELMRHYIEGYDRLRVFKPSAEDLETKQKLKDMQERLQEMERKMRTLSTFSPDPNYDFDTLMAMFEAFLRRREKDE